MKKLFQALALLFFSISFNLQAQKKTDTLNLGNSGSISPLTSHFGNARDLSTLVGPNVAAFEKRAHAPVNYNTGQLNFSIPLMNLKIDENLSIPINLSYASSGLKPEEIPSWTGNGWDLNVGGTIVQYFKGQDDFGTAGLQIPFVRTNLNNYHANLLTPENRYNYLWSIAKNEMDSQFDVFSLNMLGRSNQFYFDGSTVRLINQQQLKVELSSNIFTITDELGYRFIFGQKTLSTGSYTNDIFGDMIFKEGTYTWFLTKIITPNSIEVNFTYSPDIAYEINNKSTSFSNGKVITGYNCTDQASYQPSYSNGTRAIQQYLLKKIEAPAGSIEFQHTDRNDLMSPNGTKSKALDVLRMKNMNNEVIQKVSFQYAYMDAISQDRLMLNAIQTSGKDTTTFDTYNFEYFSSSGPVPIPGLTRPSNLTNPANHGVDYQGYYNGATANTDKVPQFAYPENGYARTTVIGGANRSPNQTYSREGMLQKVTYPDKGYDLFEYEANFYIKPVTSLTLYETPDAETFYSEVYHSLSAHCETITQDFDIANAISGARVTLSMQALSSPVTIRIQRLSDMAYIVNTTLTPIEELEQSLSVNFTAGSYKYEIVAACGSSDSFTSAFFTIEKPITEDRWVKTGGNRIAKIKRYRLSQQPDIRRIKYLSGYPTSNLNFTFRRAVAYQGYNTSLCTNCGDSFVVTEHNIYSFDGFHVQYKQVNEKAHLKGRSALEYLTWDTIGEAPTMFDDIVIPSFPWRNGLLEQSKQYLKMTKVVSWQKNTYAELNVTPPYDNLGLVSKFSYNCPTAELYNIYSPWDIFSLASVPLYTDKSGMLTSIDRSYTDNDFLLKEDTTFFDYNARWQPYRIQRSRSDGYRTVQTSYYAEDFDNLAATNIATLKTKHIVGKPLKVINTINGNTTSAEVGQPDANGNINQVYRYESDVNHVHNPATLISSDFILEETRMYNSKGKISSFTTKDGVNFVYLWSYNYTHPVALIANASIIQVEASIGSIETFGALTSESTIASQLSLLETSLTQSQLTTALYEPGIGIKQLKSPDGMLYYYEYDGMNRLKTVKDRNGKELDAYSYQNALTLTSN